MTPEMIAAVTDAFRLIVPEMILGVFACALFVGGTFVADRRLGGAAALAALALAGAALWLTPAPDATPEAVFAGPLLLDRMALLVKFIALAGGAVLVLTTWDEIPDRWAAEFHACLLVIVAGLCLTGSANELITLFVSLELISIPTYVLLYLQRTDPPAQEAAMKYFLLSVFSSALMLFGFSYLYGLAGTTNVPALLGALSRAGTAALPGVALVALVMIVAGLGFRLTAVPFHFYAPDVYQGTTTSMAALLAFVPKVAGFVALFRLLGLVAPEAAGGVSRLGLAFGPQAHTLFWILAAVTMTLGNILALLQDNLRRLLAYSSVAHAGYMLIAVAVAAATPGGNVGGVDAVLFYLVAYGGMTVGAFAVLTYLSTPEQPVETVDDLSGLARSRPGVALLMGLFLFSLIGIPFTAGFAGKFLIFFGAMGVDSLSLGSRRFQVLALLGAVNAAIGGWYYLRIVGVMYLRDPIRPVAGRRSRPTLAAVWSCAAVTLVFGVYAWPLLHRTQEAGAPPQAAAAAPPDR
ncbi:MAG TPA: NADH-quinone oxidoreductase subunit N [Gemmataceae bacterium]|nr:NADH-quinone oxidoreductase subunit N [Gemmataceae bacterium]